MGWVAWQDPAATGSLRPWRARPGSPDSRHCASRHCAESPSWSSMAPSSATSRSRPRCSPARSRRPAARPTSSSSVPKGVGRAPSTWCWRCRTACERWARRTPSSCPASMPLEREGGQAQFIAHAAPQLDSPLAALLTWAERHVSSDLSLGALAARARMSERTFSRQFRSGGDHAGRVGRAHPGSQRAATARDDGLVHRPHRHRVGLR